MLPPYPSPPVIILPPHTIPPVILPIPGSDLGISLELLGLAAILYILYDIHRNLRDTMEIDLRTVIGNDN